MYSTRPELSPDRMIRYEYTPFSPRRSVKETLLNLTRLFRSRRLPRSLLTIPPLPPVP